MIFLDMDGVLVDFVGGVERLFGKKCGKWRGKGCLHEVLDVPLESLISKIKTAEGSFWLNLEPLPVGRRIINCLNKRNLTPVILSSPTNFPESIRYKIRWLKCHYPNLKKHIWTDHKSYVSGAGRILIDDMDHNCISWESAGGISICVPQPWNKEMCSPVRKLCQKLPKPS